VPYPVPEVAAQAWARLPDPDRLGALCEAALATYGAGPRGRAVAGPGTQAIIERLPLLGAGRARVAVVGPTYGEHARAWRRAGHEVSEVTDLPGAAAFDVVVLTHPNNPDGRMFAPGDLMALADDLGAQDRLMVVDEAFADVVPGRSLVPEVGHRGLLVLRSFGKFYGLAGLRLGFALGHARIVERIADLLGPWAVSGPAIEVGIAALADRNWADAARRRLINDAHRVDGEMRKLGILAVAGTPLFRLVEHDRADLIHKALAEAGVWTRKFDYAPHWLRFGLPAGESQFTRLEGGLARAASEVIAKGRHAGD
jgi:cobalamin biosynthetic protein CobC